MMRFEQTMSGLVVHDVRNANGHIHFRVVGSLLRSNLMKLHHGIRSTVAGTFAAELASHGQIKGGEMPLKSQSLYEVI